MGILSAFGASPKQPLQERSSYDPTWLQALNAAFMQSASSGTTTTIVNEQTALTVAAIYSANRLLSELPASLDLQVRRRVEGSNYFKEDTNGKVADVLRKPNKFQTSFVFYQSMFMKMNMRGNSYAFIYRTATGELELIPIYNQNVQVTISPNGDEVFYVINGIPFASYEMIHFKGMSLDGILGLSPITYASRMINNAVDSERYMSKVYESGIISTGFFTTAERLLDKTYERLKKDIADKSGISRAGEAQILEQGLKFERNTLTAADTQIIEQMEFSVEEVCRIYRIPKHLLYLDSKGGSSRSFSTQAREFLTYSLAPFLNNIQEELATKLLTEKELSDGNTRIVFDTKALLRVDPKERGDFYHTMFNVGSMTPDEIRAEEGMPPVEGGDKAFVPLNLAPINMVEKIITDKIEKQINSTNG